jgi:hypothetical protein
MFLSLEISPAVKQLFAGRSTMKGEEDANERNEVF